MASRCPTGPSAGSRSRAPPAAGTWPTTGSAATSRTAGIITGDSYLRDADGYFWYQARADDIIISAGYNIAGPEIEEALLLHPDVAECGVVGVPDRNPGPDRQGLRGAAQRRRGHRGDGGRLQDFVKQQIAPYKYPRAVAFLPALPRTTTGKLQRFRLREAEAPGNPGPLAG